MQKRIAFSFIFSILSGCAMETWIHPQEKDRPQETVVLDLTGGGVDIAANTAGIQNKDPKPLYLSNESLQEIREAALAEARTAAQTTVQNIAEQTVQASLDKAMEAMREEFTALSNENLQKIRTAALSAAEAAAQTAAQNTAEQTVTNSLNKALQTMREEFTALSNENLQKIRETAQNTAEQTVTNSLNKALQTMREEFTALSNESLQEIREAVLSAKHSLPTKEEAEQAAAASMNQAIQNMEQKFSDLLKTGLQTIISAAISATVNAIRSAEDDSTLNAAISVATENAVFEVMQHMGFTENDLVYMNRPAPDVPFEECSWRNQSYTNQIVLRHGGFLLSDPLEDMLRNWEAFQNKPHGEKPAPGGGKTEEKEDFAYLSPLYENFILTFFQDSMHDFKLSENDVPLECFFAGAVRGANLYNAGQNFYYCEKDSNQPGNMSVKDDRGKKRVISPRRACLNRHYIHLTAIAFNKTADCFGYDKTKKESIFNLLNHESSFLHNIKSPTGAKCYGQLTKSAINEINKQIYFRDTNSPYPYSFIYDEVIQRCPGLKNVILNHEISASIEQGGKKSLKKFQSIVSNSPISCPITQNPYSCLFYAFYNIKKNFIAIETQLQSPTSLFGGQNNVPAPFKEMFFLPIPLNAMTGVTTAAGRELVFWDDSELWSALKNRPLENLSNIRRLPLFANEEEVQELFSFWTYNGGISITLKYMTQFIQQLKRSIAAPCNENPRTKICRYRFAVERGEGLSTADIREDFQRYISKNYQKDQQNADRRKEVTHFVNNVTRSAHYLHDENSGFKSHLKTLVPGINEREIESFQNHLRKVCPKP